MFRRKKTEGEDGASDQALAPENLVAPAAKVGPRPGFGPGASQPAQPTLPNRIPATPLRPVTPEVIRPMATELPRRPAEPLPTAPGSNAAFGAMPAPAPAPVRQQPELRQLLVGREITLSGEITTCDRLLVEGSVEANLSNCKDIEIAHTGLFKGTASVDHAEIHGRFEGSLTVKTRLLIKATGRVSGTIRYGQLEVECGGQVSGDVQSTGLDAIEVKPSGSASSASSATNSDLPLHDLSATRIV
ncbi:MAG TPA: polymer-forming cytoskeletal protein [Aliidongia sp.]|uniref:bactofilin family protein n=1 Tax=Aliidongia sp. TaxID=1914230 RepID=UPI002DDCBAC9|nr:polymer-forming cytoskeletal protein [Aliidongia sp.]HEV2678247.1 polymer-forming cytoskeletal protein [Aliidongia sp.]